MCIFKKYKKTISIFLSIIIVSFFISLGLIYNSIFVPKGKSELLIYLGTYSGEIILNKVFVREFVIASRNKYSDCKDVKSETNKIDVIAIDNKVIKLTHYGIDEEHSKQCLLLIHKILAEEEKYILRNYMSFPSYNLKNNDTNLYRSMKYINEPYFTMNPNINTEIKVIFLMLILGILFSIYLWRKI